MPTELVKDAALSQFIEKRKYAQQPEIKQYREVVLEHFLVQAFIASLGQTAQAVQEEVGKQAAIQIVF